jgi:hypothetical protein
MTATVKNKKSIKHSSRCHSKTPGPGVWVANVLEKEACLDKFSCKPEED